MWVEQLDGESILRLEQSNIPTEEQVTFDVFMGCGQGWSFWMVDLKAWLEHGILLNDKE